MVNEVGRLEGQRKIGAEGEDQSWTGERGKLPKRLKGKFKAMACSDSSLHGVDSYQFYSKALEKCVLS